VYTTLPTACILQFRLSVQYTTNQQRHLSVTQNGTSFNACKSAAVISIEQLRRCCVLVQQRVRVGATDSACWCNRQCVLVRLALRVGAIGTAWVFVMQCCVTGCGKYWQNVCLSVDSLLELTHSRCLSVCLSACLLSVCLSVRTDTPRVPECGYKLFQLCNSVSV
jgi:hypothetical protein